MLPHDAQGVADGVGHQGRRRRGLGPGVVARAARVERGDDGPDGVRLRRVGEGSGDVGWVQGRAGYEGEVWVGGKGVRAADEGRDGVVAREGFGEGEGAGSATGAEEENAHCGGCCYCCLVLLLKLIFDLFVTAKPVYVDLRTQFLRHVGCEDLSCHYIESVLSYSCFCSRISIVDQSQKCRSVW